MKFHLKSDHIDTKYSMTLTTIFSVLSPKNTNNKGYVWHICADFRRMKACVAKENI